MSALQAQTEIARALREPRPDDLISGVRSAVISQLKSLDPSTEIKATGYFNHSYVPDLILQWKEGGKKVERDVFLRFTLRSAALGKDVASLSWAAPIVLALKGEEDAETLEVVREEIDENSGLLVTDITAIEQFSSGGARPTALWHDDVDPTPARVRFPLLALVRANVIRGGRGLLTTSTTQGLRRAATQDPETRDEISNLDEFTHVVGRLFRGEAAVRLERAAQLMKIGITGDTSPLILPAVQLADAERQVVDGRLSEAELRVVLPYLLGRSDVTADPLYWAHIGSMLSLESLEAIADDLVGVDLTRLVEPNLGRWLATRAALGFNVQEDSGSSSAPRWEIRARMLNMIAGHYRIMLTADGRRIKGREESRPARWDRIRDQLNEFHLSGVTLQGLNRRVRVTGERDADVYRDVQSITANIHDSFHVPMVELRSRKESPIITADFTRMVATAKNPVLARELIRVVTDVLARGSDPHV
ncbi:hypothetical protein ACFY30_00530 [Streptomyces sp. NPDC000345]|uniref:hypothetical protein n=1 Tax=Streptomyces sp. NPDC000345 TaxID=3364537 RepID=UPI0036A05221